MLSRIKPIYIVRTLLLLLVFYLTVNLAPKPSVDVNSSESTISSSHMTQELPMIAANVRVGQNYIDEYKSNFEIILNHDDSSEQRLANLIHTYQEMQAFSVNFDQFNSGSAERDARNEQLVAGLHVNQQQCGRQLDQMLQLMEEMSNNSVSSYQDRHLRMARLLDSFGHYDSGHLAGRMHSFGAYDQCLNTQLDLSEHQPLTRTRFCWAKFTLDEHLSEELSQVDQERQFLRVGICLPESCHSNSLSSYRSQLEKLIYSQFKLPVVIYKQHRPKLNSIFCTVDQNSQIGIPTNGKVLIGLLLVWFGLTLVASSGWRREAPPKEPPPPPPLSNNFLDCLDLRTSWLELFHGQQLQEVAECKATSRRRVQLNTLNPIKWASCTFIIFAHVLLARVSYGANTVDYLHRMETSYFGTFVLNGIVFVDSFFVISGMMMSYVVMKKANKTTTLKAKSYTQKTFPSSGRSVAYQFVRGIYGIIKARYLRLMPLLALVYWFKRSVFTYLGSGPLWDFGFNKDTLYGGCQHESWLSPFTFASAFQPLARQCLLQSWSVSSDMFFVLIYAPILLLMAASKQLKCSAGHLISLLICLASLLWVSIDLSRRSSVRAHDISAMRQLWVQGIPSLINRASHLYTWPIYRMFSYGIGVLAGYYLYEYERNEQIKQWPQWFTKWPTRLAIGFIIIEFCIISNGAILKPYLEPHHELLFLAFMTFVKLLWAASNAILFLRMATDWNDSCYLMRMSSSPMWQTISRLGYAMLLIHFDLIIYDTLATAQAKMVTNWTVFQSFSSVYILSTVLSVVVFVALENPIDRLVRSLL